MNGSANGRGERGRRADALFDGSIAWIRGERAGPLLLVVGGLHGNEPAGVWALQRVARRVRERRRRLRGDFVALAGNLEALRRGRRFLSYDLNRVWTPSRIEALRSRRASSAGGDAAWEDRAALRLLQVFEEAARRRRGPAYVLDIHTTSSGGGAFTTASDRARNRRFAMAIPAPLVMKLDEHLEGTLTSYLDSLGYAAAVFECGQHEEVEAKARAKSAIWLAIRAAGLLDADAAPEARAGRRRLEAAYRDLPHVLEMRYRHAVAERDGYSTRPGFANFQPVRAGQAIGDDLGGEVVAPESGRLLMPLYQELGEDGFFIVRETAGRRPEPATEAPDALAATGADLESLPPAG